MKRWTGLIQPELSMAVKEGRNAAARGPRVGNAVFGRPLSGCQESERVLPLVLTLQMNSSLAEEAGGDEGADMVKQTKNHVRPHKRHHSSTWQTPKLLGDSWNGADANS